MDSKRKFRATFFAVLFLVFVLLIVLKNASAFGVSHSFICPDEPVIVYPGQETNVQLGMQNMGVKDGEDANIRVTLRDGKGIAELDDKNYIIKANTKDTKIDIKVKIPQNVQIGNKYDVVVGFDNAASGKKGGVAINTGIDVKICVEVVPEYPIGFSPTGAKTFNVNAAVLIAVIIIILAMIVVLIILKRRKRNSVRLNRHRELNYR